MTDLPTYAAQVAGEVSRNIWIAWHPEDAEKIGATPACLKEEILSALLTVARTVAQAQREADMAVLEAIDCACRASVRCGRCITIDDLRTAPLIVDQENMTHDVV